MIHTHSVFLLTPLTPLLQQCTNAELEIYIGDDEVIVIDVFFSVGTSTTDDGNLAPNTTPSTKNNLGSSSSGCNVGLSVLGLLSLILLMRKK